MNVYCTINFMSMSYDLYTLENIQYYEGETCKISCFSDKISAQNGLQGNKLETVADFLKYNQKININERVQTILFP